MVAPLETAGEPWAGFSAGVGTVPVVAEVSLGCSLEAEVDDSVRLPCNTHAHNASRTDRQK